VVALVDGTAGVPSLSDVRGDKSESSIVAATAVLKMLETEVVDEFAWDVVSGILGFSGEVTLGFSGN
jgi:hypothetical protein